MHFFFLCKDFMGVMPHTNGIVYLEKSWWLCFLLWSGCFLLLAPSSCLWSFFSFICRWCFWNSMFGMLLSIARVLLGVHFLLNESYSKNNCFQGSNLCSTVHTGACPLQLTPLVEHLSWPLGFWEWLEPGWLVLWRRVIFCHEVSWTIFSHIWSENLHVYHSYHTDGCFRD